MTSVTRIAFAHPSTPLWTSTREWYSLHMLKNVCNQNKGIPCLEDSLLFARMFAVLEERLKIVFKGGYVHLLEVGGLNYILLCS